jgi:hypothetical protein
MIVKRPSIPATMSMLPVLLRAASLVFMVVLADTAGGPARAEDERPAPPRRVYSHLLDPRENPDYDRRAVKPPSWETFKNRTQFTCLRGFDVQNLHIAASTALLSQADISADAAGILKARLGLWLLAAPQVDQSGKLWNAHAPLHRVADRAPVAAWLSLAPDAPVLMDAVFASPDEEYLDAQALERLGAKTE